MQNSIKIENVDDISNNNEKRKEILKFCMIFACKHKCAQNNLRMFILDKF